MNLSCVFTVLGQHEMATLAIRRALKNAVLKGTRVYVVDNGGDYDCPILDDRLEVNHVGRNLGVYPVFKSAFEQFEGGVMLFLHSDLIIDEAGYDSRIMQAFDADKTLGLVGFVGSDQIDAIGGRGGGTVSNFLGRAYKSGEHDWIGSPAEAHGMRYDGFTPAAVVDGCAMAIRRDAWEAIGNRENFPPHHHYDRLISCQMLEARWNVAVLGIACDHLSNQTVGKEKRYWHLAEEWSREHVHPSLWAGVPSNWAWDQTIYQEAERQFLREWRDQKHFIPIRV